ncbi:ash family protein [Salmonella enterica]|uniref:Ash family protein n=3 Tax=Salmonella enterica TaxID=28901 RepID=A0A8F6T1Y6_SALET|nr:ash family protein [Salmonella enterica]EBA1914388.1 hypothetical protein [Salmonella enterica]EBP0194932.1 hypothetical protein [Salmonella enterica]EBP0213727.1 hypothetical protein [Salmonella enterica]EBQ6307952.1 hypothetical protein [Salmonella enterica]EBU2796927.1 hypothetical protein [Salmonella enterica]
MGALSTPIAGGKPMKRTPITTICRPHKMIDRTTPPGYRYPALYKTSAGIGTPKQQVATPDAKSVFFVVRYTRHSMAWCAYLMTGCPQALDHATVHRATPIMVTLAGQPQGWPVPTCAGSSNPVNVTAPIEIGTSGGDSIHMQVEAV